MAHLHGDCCLLVRVHYEAPLRYKACHYSQETHRARQGDTDSSRRDSLISTIRYADISIRDSSIVDSLM